MGSLSQSETLKLKIHLAEPRLELASHAFWEHRRLGDLFPDYLFRLYCSMRATVPLMEAARQHARALAHSCPVAARLVPYFTRHVREEYRHDEWMLDDMETLGMRRAEVLARTPDPEVAALIGTLYYWVLYAHPVALLAFFAVTEGSPMSSDTLDRIANTRHIPRDALRTLYKHAVLDVRHGQDVFRVLDSLPLTAEHEALLGLAAVVAIEQLSVVIEGLLAEAGGDRRGGRRPRA